MKKPILLAMAAALAFALLPHRVFAAGGQIHYLIAWGGYAPNTPVTVQTTVQANPDRINNSSLYYTILSPSNQVVATHRTDVPRLEPYYTFTDEWSTNNSGWPEGNYTIRVCWSTGNATNCNIAGPVETTRYFVPSLGWLGTAAVLALIVAWAWRRRALFVPVGRSAS